MKEFTFNESLLQFNSPVYNQSYINEGKGQTVLLLHGLFGNLKLWRRTINALKSNYNVVIPRLPLFELPPDHANLQYQVEVLHEFISSHYLDDVILVGQGVGSQLALLYTHEHPEIVNRVVISGSTGFLFESDAALLNQIYNPVLLLWGLEDKITAPEVAMHFHDYLQNSVVHFIDRCGHVPMIEQPEAYNWHLTQFIQA